MNLGSANASVNGGPLNSFRFGVAFGLALSSFYLICIVLMALGGAALSTQILNSIFHGLDFSSLMHTEVPIGRRLVGLLGSFFVGCLFGTILAGVYNFLGGGGQVEASNEGEKYRSIGGDLTQVDGDFVFYKSVLSEGPAILLLIVLSICAFYHSFMYPELTEHVSLPFLGFIPLPLLAIAPLVLLGYVIHRLFDRRYVIGSHYVRSIKGLLSFSKSDMRLEYKDIRGIEIDRSLYGRIFDIGTIKIGSAMAEYVEIEMPGVLHPSRIRDVLLACHKESQRKHDAEVFDMGRTKVKEVNSD